MPDEQMFDQNPSIQSTFETPIVDLTETLYPRMYPEIQLKADEIGLDAWQEIINATQNDKITRGFDLLRKKGRVRRSDVFEGTTWSFDTPLTEIVKQKLWRKEYIGTIHTHFFDDKVNEGATTGTFSLKDLTFFKQYKKARIMGMVDVGGAHLLIRNRPSIYHGENEWPNVNFVADIIKEVTAKGGVMLDIMKKIAEILKLQGTDYYFTPNLTPQPNGFVKLQRVQTLDALPKRE